MEFIVHVNTLISDDKGRILFVREKKEFMLNKLNLPGGHLNHGEKLTDGAIREVKEEVGVKIRLTGLLNVVTKVGPNHYFGFVFAGKIISGTVKANLAEVNSIQWCTPDELAQWPDEELVNPVKDRLAVKTFTEGRMVPVRVIEELF